MSTPKKLVVYSVDLNNLKKKEMASFELHGDEVKATYKNKLFERDLEDGIYVRGKKLKPADGSKFMEALEANYAQSSTISVERS